MGMDIRIAAYGVIVQDGRILLSHWNEGDRTGWTMPGGGIEDGEHPLEAAQREIREETGYETEIEQLRGIDSIVIPASHRITPGSTTPLHAMRIIYRARISGGVLTNEVAGSTDEARWIDVHDVTNLDRVELVDTALRLYEEQPVAGRLSLDPRS